VFDDFGALVLVALNDRVGLARRRYERLPDTHQGIGATVFHGTLLVAFGELDSDFVWLVLLLLEAQLVSADQLKPSGELTWLPLYWWHSLSAARYYLWP
jgi:hypothetical protein